MDKKIKKFSKIFEDNSTDKHYKVKASVELAISASNEGEAGYQSDAILGGIEEQLDFRIEDIEEITTDDFKKLTESKMNELKEKWTGRKNKLVRTFKFDGFREAVKFINEVADFAEITNHHPEIENNFDKVTIKLPTTGEKDKRMSKKIDYLFDKI